jgi:hypothetical protein
VPIHVAPIVLHLRLYDDGVDVERPLHEMRGDYLAHSIVVVGDNGVGRLEGLDSFAGNLPIKVWREMIGKLKQYGVRRLEWRHHGIEHGVGIK